MTLNLTMPQQGEELRPRITVFGVGGAGGNAVNNMIEKNLEGVEFVVGNTDAQALQQNQATAKVQLGIKVTEGLGAGAKPEIGSKAAEESIEQIVDHLAGAHMCFITAGMGGGTGTGAAPIIAQAARELGVLTIGVVTKPFGFEGTKRMRQAESGIDALQKVVDTLIIIPNQNLFRIANASTTFTEAFAMADDVLYQGVKGVTDLMVKPGLINLDFADVRSVMDEMGKAMMGTGEIDSTEDESGKPRESMEGRAKRAAEAAIANPLLDEMSLQGARGVLINVTGGPDMTLFELDEAANTIRDTVDPDANIIVGSTLDEKMTGKIRVSVVATGIDAIAAVAPQPQRRAIPEAAPAPQISAPAPAPQPAPQPAPVQAMAPAPQPAPVQQVAPAPQPAPAPAPVAAAPEPLSVEDQLDAEGDMPPPAYAPPEEQPAARAEEEFVAPRAPAVGGAAPDAHARIQSAMQAGPRPRAAAPKPAPEKASRFANIGGFLGKMTGQPDEAPRPEPRRPQAVEAAPVAYDEDYESDPETDRIEIPAFLRRQAN